MVSDTSSMLSYMTRRESKEVRRGLAERTKKKNEAHFVNLTQ